MNATDSYANFGSVSDHPLRLMVNSSWRMLLDSDNSLTMFNGATCTSGGAWLDSSSRELKENAPNLSFVYVDVYNGKNWVEWKLGEKLNEYGWPVWTEFHPHFDNYYIWTHQPAGGSKIGGFIMNHQEDTYHQRYRSHH